MSIEKGKGLIVCVDDEELILDIISSQLDKTFGDHYQIETAQSAEDGLEILDEYKHDGFIPLVIVSDWLMPGMKGDQFLIEAHKSYPNVITVMLTGQAPEEAVENAKNKAELFEYITKPWDVNELIETIKKGIETYESKNNIMY